MNGGMANGMMGVPMGGMQMGNMAGMGGMGGPMGMNSLGMPGKLHHKATRSWTRSSHSTLSTDESCRVC